MSESDAERLVRIETKLDHLIKADEDVKTRVEEVEAKTNGRIDKAHDRVEKIEVRVGYLERTAAGDKVRWSTVGAVALGALGVGGSIGAALMRTLGG